MNKQKKYQVQDEYEIDSMDQNSYDYGEINIDGHDEEGS